MAPAVGAPRPAGNHVVAFFLSGIIDSALITMYCGCPHSGPARFCRVGQSIRLSPGLHNLIAASNDANSSNKSDCVQFHSIGSCPAARIASAGCASTTCPLSQRYIPPVSTMTWAVRLCSSWRHTSTVHSRTHGLGLSVSTTALFLAFLDARFAFHSFASACSNAMPMILASEKTHMPREPLNMPHPYQ